MNNERKVIRASKSRPTIEGAGVRLRRAFGFGDTRATDPFLLLDDFRSNEPALYLKGFPWHPHRGIETITYMLDGTVEHGDSLGNRGVIAPGGVQWMTAGNGIIHQEMPKGDGAGRMGGFQLWANLPASHKMMAPRYRDIWSEQIPIVTTADGAAIRVICGEVNGVRGPAQDVVIEPEYLDVTISPGCRFTRSTPLGATVIAYVIQGRGRFDEASGESRSDGDLLVFGDGEQIVVTTQAEPVRFLFISGRPLHEPVAWYGPIVMNTQEELQTAFEEYQNGTFIKHS